MKTPPRSEFCGVEFHDSHPEIQLHLQCDREAGHPGWHNDSTQTEHFWNHEEATP